MRIRAAVVAALAGAALAVPAAPATAAACTQGSGVTVVVDFASLGGGTQIGCATGDPSSGLAALRGTGHTPTRAAQEPGYFLCRIDGKPANDPCQRTSQANAYWSYWHAKPGGSWTYSSRGPADYDPAPGTVEGWAFGAGKPPSSPPPRAAPPSSTPAPATRVLSPTMSRAPVVAARTTAQPALRSSAPTPVTSPSPTVAAPSAAPSPSTRPSADPNSATKTFTSRGYAVPWSVVVGILLVLLIGLGALVTAARRRRGEY